MTGICQMGELTPRGLRFSEIVVEIFRDNGLLLQAGDALCLPLGLTSARWQVMGIIEHGPASVAQVARAMGLSRQSVRETAGALVRDGLAVFTPNPQHRTARLLSVTARGAETMRRLAGVQARWANAIGARASKSELDAMLAGLRRLGELVQSAGPDGAPARGRRRTKQAPR